MKNVRSPRHAAAVAALVAGLTLATALPAVAADPATVSAASDHGSPGQGPVTSAKNSPSAFAAASSAAPAIKRSTVIARADSWVGKGLDYSWTGSHEGYRTDCSGYVSMAWNLDSSLTTPTFASAGVTETISKGELKAGDALLDDDAGASGHIVLFHKWANDAKTEYWGYEFSGSGVHHRVIPYPYFTGSGPYVPVRNKSIVDDAPAVEAGSVWNRERSASGVWQAAASHIDVNTSINGFAAAGLADGSLHVQTLVNGDLWDRARSAGGTWQKAATKIDDNGSLKGVASAALPDGSLHVQTLVNGDVWDRVRSADGTWSNATKIDDNGSITKISSAALPDGTLHVQALVNGDVWDRTRRADGTWTSATKIDDNGSIQDVAATALPNGTLHVQALVNGDVWNRSRSAAGVWDAGATKIDDNGSITDVSSAGLADGTLHVQAVVHGNVWDRTRRADGSWTSATKTDENGSIFDTYAAALPNGSMHVGTLV
ncbi:hypothetical protein [Streptomyces sp. WG5]|uniref:hypothetical protein n=1 Tax=Streptomyces sp. WG5 TaxID=3417648 RepID=UPI003CF69ADF